MKSSLKKAFATAAVMLLAGGALSPDASAADKTLGFAGGFASYNNGGYANLYFHAPLASHVRLAPEIGYIFRNEDKSGFECSVDVHFPFRMARGINVYPLTGVTVNNWSYRKADHVTRAGFDFGGGFDICMTPSLKLTLQGKYSLMNDTGGCFIEMGIGYNF